jgi:hypothetical protein
MNVVFKRILIAAALMVVCAVILAATKSYGVWVITAIAVVLFVFGLLKKEKSPDMTREDRHDNGKSPSKEEIL